MDVGEREKGYITISNSILELDDLTITEKVILGRMAGFEQYFESKETCAEALKMSASSVQKAKTKLEKLGYIQVLKNTGHGKKYKVYKKWRADFQPTATTSIKAVKKDIAPTPPIDHPKFTPSISSRKQKIKKTSWDKQHPDLIDARDRAIQYLRNNGIPVNIPTLNIGISNITETFPNVNGGQLINVYIDYLESPAYLFQKSKNQYCPTIKSTNDFSDKFARIREFKNNRKQHYDPTKNFKTK